LTSIFNLNDLLKVIDLSFERRIKEGIIGIKTALAYNRVICYEKVTKYQAERVFNRVFDHLGFGVIT